MIPPTPHPQYPAPLPHDIRGRDGGAKYGMEVWKMAGNRNRNKKGNKGTTQGHKKGNQTVPEPVDEYMEFLHYVENIGNKTAVEKDFIYTVIDTAVNLVKSGIKPARSKVWQKVQGDKAIFYKRLQWMAEQGYIEIRKIDKKTSIVIPTRMGWEFWKGYEKSGEN